MYSQKKLTITYGAARSAVRH